MALGQVVDGPAEGRMSLKQVDVPPLRVQDVGGQSGEDVQVGNELTQLLFIKQCIHFWYFFTMVSSSLQCSSISATSLN